MIGPRSASVARLPKSSLLQGESECATLRNDLLHARLSAVLISRVNPFRKSIHEDSKVLKVLLVSNQGLSRIELRLLYEGLKVVVTSVELEIHGMHFLTGALGR